MAAGYEVAVLMAARNAAPWIADAVASTLAQSYRAFRLFLVDDGSTDGSADIALGAAAGDPRLVLSRRPPRGFAEALLDGLDQIPLEVPLIARMDADDVMDADRLGRQRDAMLARADVSVLSSRVRLLRDFEPGTETGVDEGGMARYVAWLNDFAGSERLALEMFVEAPVCHPAVMIRADVLRAIPYRSGAWTEDYDLWLRLHAAGHRFFTVPETLLTWRDHSRRYTRTDPRCTRERLTALKAHYLVRLYGPDLRIWGAGRDGRRLARALEAEGARLHAFFDIDPRKIGSVRRGHVPILGPGEVRPGPPIIAAVGIPTARMEIRQLLDGIGFLEGRDYVCAA